MLTPCQALVQSPDQPAYQVSLSSMWDGSQNALIRIQVSDDSTQDHLSNTIVLVLDESGSMGNAAVHHDDSDGNSGLSQLDIVKHAARTIVEILSEHDRLAIVAFSDVARVVLPLTWMTAENKQATKQSIDSLVPSCTTNLYDGLFQALELIRTDETASSGGGGMAGATTSNTNANILLLTDGMPNVRPPRGELATLRSYLDSHPTQRSSTKISTFGFGYSLQSHLLFDLVREGGSLYAFIPDSSFVGTVFINAVANLLSMAVPNGATLRLEAQDGVEIVNCLSGQTFSKTSWGINIEIPSLLYGQSLDICVQLGSIPSSMNDHVTTTTNPFRAFVQLSNVDKILQCDVDYISTTTDHPSRVIFQTALVRSALVDFVKTVEWNRNDSNESRRNDLFQCQQRLENTKAQVASSIDSSSSSISCTAMNDIQSDLTGQVTEAYSSDAYYQKWGRHYILSLARAHVLQQCINFKDPGIQHYATGKFCQIRDAAEAVFLTLPPPKPSRRAVVPVVSMQRYHNCSAPCFAAGMVLLADGSEISIDQLCAGMVVQTSQGASATVRCVVETPITAANGMEPLVELEQGVLVTPWHPVRRRCDDTNHPSQQPPKWTFPCFLAEARPRPCQSLYSFVLEGDVSLCVGPYDGIALGHGLGVKHNMEDDRHDDDDEKDETKVNHNAPPEEDEEETILYHEYLGTDRVLQDLARMDGWSKGHVRLASKNPTIQDPKTHRIIGFRQ